MKLTDIIENLALDVKTTGPALAREVTGVYVSDLLSDVIGNAHEGFVWVTLQVHLNIIAVASLKGLSGIILVNSRMPDEETLKKAEAEHIPLMTTALSTFEVAGRLYSLGLRCR